MDPKPDKDLRLAIFRSIDVGALNGYQTIGSKEYETFGSYVRISEYADVKFDPLKSGAVIEGAMKALDRAELQAREKLEETLNQIRDQRQQLLALTHKPE